MVYKDLGGEIQSIVRSLRENPQHILNWLKKEQALWDDPEAFVRHKHFYDEDFLFVPDEDIMVYADFYAQLPPMPSPPEALRLNPPHRHEFFEMVYVYSGEAVIYYNDEEYTLAPGTLWLMDTRCSHGIWLKDRREGLVFNILVRSSTFNASILNMIGENDLFLNFFLSSFGGSDARANYMRFDIESEEIAEFYIFNLISEYYRKAANSQSILKFMYSALLVELSRKYKEKNLLASAELSAEIVDIVSYISDNISTVTLEDISKRFHYSPRQISRLINAHTGMNFSDYLRRFRLGKGAYLLARTDLPAEKIAEIVGYCQRSSFDKEFKKHYGKTPAAYRREKL